jgi:hypothetical protein
MLPHLFYWIGAAADGWTTERALDRGAREANPVARWLVKRMGDRGLLVAKVAGYALLLVSHAPDWSYWLAGALQLAAAAWNWRGVLLPLYRRARRD